MTKRILRPFSIKGPTQTNNIFGTIIEPISYLKDQRRTALESGATNLLLKKKKRVQNPNFLISKYPKIEITQNLSEQK